MKPAADAIDEKRRHSELEMLRHVADGLSAIVAVVVGPDLLLRYANPAFQALTQADAVEGASFDEFWPSSPDAVTALRSVMETGEPVELGNARYAVSSPDGSTYGAYLTFRYSPLVMDGQAAVLIEGIDTTAETEARLQAEADALKARQSLSDLSDVFENMADGFLAVDERWRFKYVNSAAEELIHRRREDILTQTVWDAFPELVGTTFYERAHDAMHNRVAVSFEDYYAPNQMWASLHIMPLERGLALYVADITARKRTEAALATSESQLRAVIDNCPSVIYMEDTEGRFIRVNDEFVDRFGTTKEQAIGKTDYDFFPASTADQLRGHDLAVLRTGTSHQFEEDVELKDGRHIQYLSTKFPLKDVSGRVYATAGISTDINERIRQERALADSEQRFRKVFQEGPMGIALLDTALNFAQVNDRYAEMLGYSTDEMIGRSINDITVAEDRALSAELPSSLVRGEIPYYRVEKRSLRRDGTVCWVSVHGSLLKDERGEPMFILQLIEDITGQKAATAALREKDMAIRQAYTEVIAAVTGGKLVLMTPSEMERALGEPVTGVWRVDDYSQLATLRHDLARELHQLGMESDAVDSYVLAGCEAFTNAIKHGEGGDIRLHLNGRTVQIVVGDHGPGIHFDHLPKATLVAGYSTIQSLGMGFTIMLDVCDRLLLSTQQGLTMLVLEAAEAATQHDAGVSSEPVAVGNAT